MCDTVGVMLAGAPEPAAGSRARSSAPRAAATAAFSARPIAPARATRRLPTASPRMRSTSTTCASSRWRIPAARWCRRRWPRRSSPTRPAAPSSTRTSSASRSNAASASSMNPRHYHERGWHCTSSIGTLGAAAAAARVLGLDAAATAHALGIAASLGLRPQGKHRHDGEAAPCRHGGAQRRDGRASRATRGSPPASIAIDGPQGYLAAMDSERPAAALAEALPDFGARWEILDTGISVKLYPSCAATHPPLDVLLELVRRASASPRTMSRRSRSRSTR